MATEPDQTILSQGWHDQRPDYYYWNWVQRQTPPVGDGDHRLFLKLQVFQQNILALIDTGAARTYMGPIMWQALERNNIRATSQQPTLVQLAEGSMVSTQGLYEVQVYVNDRPMELQCQYLPTLTTDLVLGLDFLESHQAIIDTYRRTLHFPDQNIQLISKEVPGLAGLKGVDEEQLH